MKESISQPGQWSLTAAVNTE